MWKLEIRNGGFNRADSLALSALEFGGILREMPDHLLGTILSGLLDNALFSHFGFWPDVELFLLVDSQSNTGQLFIGELFTVGNDGVFADFWIWDGDIIFAP